MKTVKVANFTSKKSVFYLILILPFVALIALMMISGSAQVPINQSSNKFPLVSVMSITLTQQYNEHRVAVGQVEALQESVIGFDRGGEVVHILVDEGQSVVLGQVMAVQDQQRIKAGIDEISATLSRVQADLRLAKLSEKRVTELVNKNLESSQRLDEVRESTAAAEALVAEIMARRASLVLELDRTKLTAPYAGIVVRRMLDQGAVVSPGQGLFVIQQQDSLQARFALPAAQAQQFSLGAEKQLLFGQQPLQVKVKSISQQRQLATRTLDVIFTLESNVSGVLAGDLVSLERTQQVEKKGLWIPKSALISAVRGLWGLYVVELNEQGHEQLVSKLVEITYMDKDQVYVSGAIADKAKIVVDGIHKLVPGQLVRTKPVVAMQGAKFSEPLL